jgi:hypothetical protein
MRRDNSDQEKLVDYGLRLDLGAVVRRLRHLLEAPEFDAPRELERLGGRLTDAYAVFDSLLPTRVIGRIARGSQSTWAHARSKLRWGPGQ